MPIFGNKKTKKRKPVIPLNTDPVKYTLTPTDKTKCTINLNPGHEILCGSRVIQYVLSKSSNYDVSIISKSLLNSISKISAKEDIQIVTSKYTEYFKNIKHFNISKDVEYYFNDYNFLALLSADYKKLENRHNNLRIFEYFEYFDYSSAIRYISNIDTKILLFNISELDNIKQVILKEDEQLNIEVNTILLTENCKVSKNDNLNNDIVARFNSAGTSQKLRLHRPHYINIEGPGTVYLVNDNYSVYKMK